MCFRFQASIYAHRKEDSILGRFLPANAIYTKAPTWLGRRFEVELASNALAFDVGIASTRHFVSPVL